MTCTASSVVPAALAMLTMPLPPSAVTAIADPAPPAGTLRAADAGLADPVAQARTEVVAVAHPAEMLSATAATPDSGTRPTPGTRRSSRCPDATGRLPSAPVSYSRIGSTGTKPVRPGRAAGATVGGVDRAASTVTGALQVGVDPPASEPVSARLYAPGRTSAPASSRRSHRALSGTAGDALPVTVRTSVVRHASRTSSRHSWSLLTRAVAVTVDPAP